MYPDKYWEVYQSDIWRFPHDNAVTENVWADRLLNTISRGRPTQNHMEEERFLYCFLIHTYRINGFTDMKELKRRFRDDYKKAPKQG